MCLLIRSGLTPELTRPRERPSTCAARKHLERHAIAGRVECVWAARGMNTLLLALSCWDEGPIGRNLLRGNASQKYSPIEVIQQIKRSKGGRVCATRCI